MLYSSTTSLQSRNILYPLATQAQKIGYVPRNQKVDLKASGLTSSSLARKNPNASDDQELDPESAAGLARVKQQDAEINDGLDSISRTLDNLGNIASNINDEVACFYCNMFMIVSLY